ncbi:LCP family protein [Planotetraspora sp. A-T 1434]|uniref:LCP family protein n=1 Tax=Planotetraspora sp. A-T 1434 TaxID=2979219 RepID=UPI0021BE56B1|nr:LCP family protein [Planotetraspora sp. A-T 1434]MCT9929357.1 LCP family protein [Planotetraspora sp. A-T 1434]
MSTRRAAALIGWVALSVVAPGAAHLRAGWKRTGYALLGGYLVVAGCAAVVIATADAGLAGRALNWLTQITVTAAVCAVAWFSLVIHSFVVLRPGTLTRAGQVVTGLVCGALAVTVAVPFALAAQYVAVSQRTIDTVFAEPAAGARGGPEAGDPWAGRDRVNVLLLGGDWGNDRIGVRTDSINVASMDVHTGNTVLLGLPRNLEHVLFPPGSPMAQRFPYGFRLPEYKPGWREDLLFSVWQYADDHPELFGGRRHMGPETLKETIGYILGIRIDWYALVNIWGFAKIIDALGGLVLTVDRDIVFGKYGEGVVPAGTRRLSGADALWYARSRTGSDDYNRMRRQRCVFNALLDQADPATVLSRFTEMAAVMRKIFQTDVPRPMLEHLVPLAWKVKHAEVTSLQFVPPLISTASPDWERIRLLTAKAIRDSVFPGHRRHRLSPTPQPVFSPIDEGCGAV